MQKQIEDKDFNEKARILADDLDVRNIRPDFKANQLSHMRRVIDRQNNYHTDSEARNRSKTLDRGPKVEENEPNFENPITYALPPGAPSIMPGMIPPAPFPPFGGVPPVAGVPPFAGVPPVPGVPPFGGPVPGAFPHPFGAPFGMPGHPIGK